MTKLVEYDFQMKKEFDLEYVATKEQLESKSRPSALKRFHDYASAIMYIGPQNRHRGSYTKQAANTLLKQVYNSHSQSLLAGI